MLKTTIKVKNEKRELTNLELQKMQDNALDHGIAVSYTHLRAHET